MICDTSIHFFWQEDTISLYFQPDAIYLLFLEILFSFLLLLHIAKISAYHLGSYLHISLSECSKAAQTFSLCHRLKYSVFSSDVCLITENIHMFWFGTSSRVHVCLLARNCLYGDCQLHSGEVRAILNFFVFVLPRKLQKKCIKTTCTDIGHLLFVTFYYCSSAFDYSFSKFSSNCMHCMHWGFFFPRHKH